MYFDFVLIFTSMHDRRFLSCNEKQKKKTGNPTANGDILREWFSKVLALSRGECLWFGKFVSAYRELDKDLQLGKVLSD